MGDSRHVDFDAFLAQRKQRRKPVTVTYAGKKWRLYPALPAAVVLRVWAMKDRERDLTGGELLELATDLVPPRVLKAWTDNGIAQDDLEVLLLMVLNKYMRAARGGGGRGEAPAPSGAPKASTPSSSTGR